MSDDDIVQVIDGVAYVVFSVEECPECRQLPAASLTRQGALRAAWQLLRVALSLRTDADVCDEFLGAVRAHRDPFFRKEKP